MCVYIHLFVLIASIFIERSSFVMLMFSWGINEDTENMKPENLLEELGKNP